MPVDPNTKYDYTNADGQTQLEEVDRTDEPPEHLAYAHNQVVQALKDPTLKTFVHVKGSGTDQDLVGDGNAVVIDVFNTVVHDPKSAWSTSNDEFTCQDNARYYLVSGQITIDDPATVSANDPTFIVTIVGSETVTISREFLKTNIPYVINFSVITYGASTSTTIDVRISTTETNSESPDYTIDASDQTYLTIVEL
jgi:hypothetical protein